jgi:release factor glutamine methyltransferase
VPLAWPDRAMAAGPSHRDHTPNSHPERPTGSEGSPSLRGENLRRFARQNDALPDAAIVRDALAWATPILSAAGVPSPRLDAEVLLAHILDSTRARLYAEPETELQKRQRGMFVAAVERRQRREPVPYIVGHREFFGLDFAVDRRVLIPRPETELLVERALESAARWARPILVDVGTGSGIVAISLAVHLPHATIYATDASIAPLQVAARNAARHGVVDRLPLLYGDLLDPLPEPVHVIVANLPYVPTAVLPTLDPDVADYEPLAALDGGPDGLLHIRRLLEQAGDCLLPDGEILLEIGAGQGQRVVGLASQQFPDAQVDCFHDYAGLDRIVRVRRNPCLSA